MKFIDEKEVMEQIEDLLNTKTAFGDIFKYQQTNISFKKVIEPL